ncbi:MFS transporter [Pseudomonas oligotrophica]|uniref:MFS transporter n=1 Tax=Pseudomonas oligotrophica TaxID=2912055 RepID=UPI001F01B75D|nr:MFS transporter [Pseudomonas oligotrophica]MCF7202358.1 MFS transporter [Pseudomonas oligotrophica]
MQAKWSTFPWVCFAMCVGVMGTALISPLYPLYQAAWGLRTSEISLIYVVYMLGALAGLLFMGRLSDTQGFRPVMLAGLLVGWGGTLLSMIAWDLASLNLGRFAVGLSSSLIVTSASVGLMQIARDGSSQRVSTLTSFLLAFGFGLGPITGGIIAQWLPRPLVTTYVPTLLLGLLAIHAMRQIALTPPSQAQKLAWRAFLPRLTWTARSDCWAFILTCCCPFFAFGVFGLYASMSPLFIGKMLPWHGPVVSGFSIGIILLASAGTQLLSARLGLRWCGALGLLAVVLSNALLVANFQAGSVAMFAAGVVAAAVGHGMCLLAGISMVNRIARPAERSGLISTYLVSGYVGSIAPLLGAGWLADHYGLQTAITALGLGVVALASPAAVAFFRHPRMRES